MNVTLCPVPNITQQGPSLVEWIPDLQLNTHLPSRSVPRSRGYTHVVYDPNTSLIVAASSRQSQFASYDDDGNIVWEPDGGSCTSLGCLCSHASTTHVLAPNVSFPHCDSSTLELLMPEAWVTMDG